MTFTKLLRPGFAAGLLVLALTACGGDGDEGASPTSAAGATTVAGATTSRIEVENFAFKPETATVKAGTTLTWVFKDSADHNVEPVGESELKKSPDLNGGETYEATLTKPGTIEYRCGIHNSMTGTVIVTA